MLMASCGLYIVGTRALERPSSHRAIFADGSADSTLREGVDLELSHWFPNRTPERYKADTSTEICMNFVASGDVDFDLVVNNHADVDGVLAVFTLLHPETALLHRAIIVSAAEMGDFWGWGELAAQVLFQTLTKEIDALSSAGVDPQITYERSPALVAHLIEEAFVDPQIEESLTPLKRSVEWVVGDEISRRDYHSRFVHYAIPAHLCEGRFEAALRVPPFNAIISDECLFWPQARSRWDREKIQLVSVETREGWYYDVWYPSYSWADTPNSWRAPGLDFTGDSNAFRLSYAPLEAAARDLERQEPRVSCGESKPISHHLLPSPEGDTPWFCLS